MSNDRDTFTGPLFDYPAARRQRAIAEALADKPAMPSAWPGLIPPERIKAAEAAAKAAGPSWLRDVEEYIIRFAAGREFFMAEEVKARWDEAKLPAPPDGRAWGSAFANLSRSKRILKIGYALDAFGSPKPRWTAGA